MNLFKTFSLTWWQAGLFKAGLLAVGILIGANWNAFFTSYFPILIAVAVISLTCVTYVWAKQ